LEVVFLQVALGVLHAGRDVVLLGVSPATFYVGYPPDASMGHIDTAEFIEAWDDGEEGSEAVTASAVLSLLGSANAPAHDVRVALSEPHLDGDVLRYRAEIVSGTLQSTEGACSLFVDRLGRDLWAPGMPGRGGRARRLSRSATRQP
jgi:hypothetical protein